MLLESSVFGVFHASFQVESQRQSIKHTNVVAAISVIVSHIYEERLFVVQMLVEFKSIVRLLHSFFACL